MPDIAELVERYFVNAGDRVQAPAFPESLDDDGVTTPLTAPSTWSGCRVTHRLDGVHYFQAIRDEIQQLLAGGADRFFYTCSWELGTSAARPVGEVGSGGGLIGASAWQHGGLKDPAFQLGGTGSMFKDDLVQMVSAGVDVRVLAWASPFLVNFEAAASLAWDYWGVNMHTLGSVLDLRAAPGMDGRIVLNTLAHTLGAMHLKLVVCGDATGYRAYAAGLDFVQNRNRLPGHGPKEWHDVGVKLEGSGAFAVFAHFANLWNEQIGRSAKKFKVFGQEVPSHTGAAKPIQLRPTPGIPDGKHHVQVLRTVPTMNFSTSATNRVDKGCFKRMVSGFRQRKISFAPEGIFEFRAAQKKAIDGARRYVYIEDQMFSNLELADWIHSRLFHVPDLKAIFLYMNDPVDGLSKILPAFMDTVIGNIPNPETRIAFGQATYTVHAKVTIVDDNWAVVGSANCMRRSFYTDGELSIAVLDEEEPSFAAKLRADLWAEHCNDAHSPQPSGPLLDFGAAAGLWNPTWGAPPAGYGLKQISLKSIPFVFATPPAANQFPAPEPDPDDLYIDTHDADSRLEY